MKKSNNRYFNTKIALFNAIGFLVTVAGVTYADEQLTTHVKYGVRHYPLSYWICLGAIPVFFISYLLAKKDCHWQLKAVLPQLPLLIMAIASAFIFRPEFPHMGVIGHLLIYILVGTFSCWFHSFPLDDSVVTGAHQRDLKVERIKESVTLWRAIALSITFGYIGLLIPWLNLIWDQPKQIVTDMGEAFLISCYGVMQVTLTSLFVLTCLISEAFRKVNLVADQLLLIED